MMIAFITFKAQYKNKESNADNSLHLSTNYKILGIIKNKHLSWLNITVHNQISITSQIPFLKVSCAYVRNRYQNSANKQRQVERGRRSSGTACWHNVGTQWRARTDSRSSGTEIVWSSRIWRLRVVHHDYHRCRGSVDYFLIDRSIGRYRRSIRIHLLENTVDIDCR